MTVNGVMAAILRYFTEFGNVKLVEFRLILPATEM